MGLAGTRTKQKFGIDPRNLMWSNDTSRFGHQHLMQMGWTPGQGLGKVDHAITSHIRVRIKSDNVGLGASLARKKDANGSVLDAGDNAYLDDFQKVLGRLNGKEEETADAIDRRRKDRIISGKRGMDFVLGDTLSSTWDAKTKTLLKYGGEDHRKRKIEDSDEEKQSKRKHKHKHKKEAKEHKHKHKHSKEAKEHKHKHKHKSSKSKKETKEDRREELLTPVPEDPSDKGPKVIGSRMALRSKWIKQKRAAVMDAKALQEIFMVR